MVLEAIKVLGNTYNKTHHDIQQSCAHCSYGTISSKNGPVSEKNDKTVIHLNMWFRNITIYHL